MTDSPGTLRQFRAEPIAFLRRLAEDGDFVRFRMARRRLVLVNHPELIQEVLVARQDDFRKGPGLLRARRLIGDGLVTADAAPHRIHRRIVQPAFWRAAIEGYRSAMAAAIADSMGWHDGMPYDWHREMARLTLTVSGRTLFGLGFAAAADQVASDIATAIAIGYGRLGPDDGREGIAGAQSAALREIRTRLEDLALAAVVKEDGDGALARLLRDALLSGELTAGEVADEAVTFLIASHEAASNALTWMFLLLAAEPACEARLLELLGSDPAAGDAYAGAVVSEALRLCPPAWMISREAVRRTQIGGRDIEAGEIVVLSQAVTHRDSRWFTAPEGFEPGRWLGDGSAALRRGAYFPFGDGARGCIGELFARQELRIALTAIARRWRIVPEKPLPVPVQALVTLRPAEAVMVRLEERRA